MCDKGNISVNFHTWRFVTDSRRFVTSSHISADSQIGSHRISPIKASMLLSSCTHNFPLSFFATRIHSRWCWDDDEGKESREITSRPNRIYRLRELEEARTQQKKSERNMSESNCSNIIDAMWCFAACYFCSFFPSTFVLRINSESESKTPHTHALHWKIRCTVPLPSEPATVQNTAHTPAMSRLKKIHK